MNHLLKIPFPMIRLIARTLLRVGFPLTIEGEQHLQSLKGPVIFAGNHSSLLDSLIMLSAAPTHFVFLMSTEVFSWPIAGKIVPFGNVLPLDLSKPLSSLRQSIAFLKQGESVCIFPEGKLSLDGKLEKFNEGAAFLQEKSQCPILPFAISGGFEAWPYGKRWPRFHPVSIRFGAPILVAEHRNRRETTQLLKETVQKLQQDKPSVNVAEWPHHALQQEPAAL